MMANVRVDNRGRTLLNGETQMPDGRYRFRYQDKKGRRQAVYSWRLIDADTIPYGKRSNPSLREQERIIKKEMEAMEASKDRIVGYVYETRDYEQFAALTGNRDVSPERFKRIEKSMLIKQLPIPTVVNENMEMIDGQGRLEVCKTHGFPIRYTVCEGLTIDDCVTANVYSTKWNEVDIVKRYAKTGDENYSRILEVMEQYAVSCSAVLGAAGKSKTTREQKDAIRFGSLDFSPHDQLVAMERLRFADEVLSALNCGGKMVKQKRVLIASIIRCAKTPGYDHKRMVKACEDNAIVYKEASSVSDMLRQLAYFYNKGKRSDFMDTYGYKASLVIVFHEKVNKFKSI